MFQPQDYQQYQFHLPKVDLYEDFMMELANVMDIPISQEAYEKYRKAVLDDNDNGLYLFRNKKTDPHTLILVKFWSSDEEDEVQFRNLVIRCRNELAEKVKQVVQKNWEHEDSLVKHYEIHLDFTNHVNGKDNWLKYFAQKYDLDIDYP